VEASMFDQPEEDKVEEEGADESEETNS